MPIRERWPNWQQGKGDNMPKKASYKPEGMKKEGAAIKKAMAKKEASVKKKKSMKKGRNKSQAKNIKY